MTRLLIFAGNFRQAQDAARERRLLPHEFVYVAEPQRLLDRQRLLGRHSGMVGIIVGTFWDRPDARELMNLARVADVHFEDGRR